MSAFTFLRKLPDVINELGEFAKVRDDIANSALRGIVYALNETAIYYDAVTKDDKKNPDTEAQLELCWKAVAIPLKPVNKPFSDACAQIRQHCLNTKNWIQDIKDGCIPDFTLALKSAKNRLRANHERSKRKAGKLSKK
jgi:hypothetical protein